jgi:hypothetical protein
VLALPRGTLAAGAIAALALLWFALLPSDFYAKFPVAVWLEGPLPALIGFSVGLWRHRLEPLWRQLLAACGYAFAVMAFVVLVPGVLTVGFSKALYGFWLLLTLVAGSIFGMFAMPDQEWTTVNILWANWILAKTLLVWGAVAYGVTLLLGHRATLRNGFGGISDTVAFNRVQRQQWKEYRTTYMAAVRAGQPVPAAPAGLVPGMGGSLADRAKLTFWGVRITLLVASAIGLWAVAGDYIRAIGRGLIGPIISWLLGFRRHDMRFLLVLLLSLAFVSPVSAARERKPEVRDANELKGVFVGTYRCMQGVTGVDMIVYRAPNTDIEVLMNIYPIPASPRLPHGVIHYLEPTVQQVGIQFNKSE